MTTEARDQTDGAQQLLLGKMLLERGLITSEQLSEALGERARSMGTGAPRPLGIILVAKGYLTDQQLVSLLGEQAHRPPSSSSGSFPSFTPSVPAASAAAPTRLGKYELVKEIGRGGMGVVYEALDTQLNRKVALKLMLTNPAADANSLRVEEERFVQEAQLSAKLKHPNIVTVYEAGVLEGRRFLAMELIDGQPMSDWRRETGAGVKQVVEVLRDVALAVHHAHEQGILHRDLKPRNVLMGSSHRPFVTDFGLAKSLAGAGGTHSLTGSGSVVGTPAYMSPEQAQGSTRIDWRTDIWSLGVMLYEALTGRTPFPGESPVEILMKVVKDPVPPPSTVVEGGAALALDRGIEAICMKALEKRDRDRYVTARAFAEDLSRWLNGEQVRSGASKVQKRTHSWAYIVGAAAGVLLVLGATWFVITRPSVEADLVQARRFMELENYIDAAAAFSGVLKIDATNKEAIEGAQKARELDAEKRKREQERLRLQLDASRREAEEARKKVDEESKKLEEALTEEERQKAIRLKAEAEERARMAEAAMRKVDEQMRVKIAVKPPPVASTEGGWAGSTNLLSMVELPTAAVWGTWTIQDNRLVSDREGFARVEIPYVPPEEYDVRLVFSRLSGAGQVAFLMPANGRLLSVELGGWKNTSIGFQDYRGARRPDHPGASVSTRALENRRLYTLEVQVRKEGVSANLDGRPLLAGAGKIDPNDYRLDASWALRSSTGFGLGSNASPSEFHRLDLLPVNGKGSRAPASQPAVFKAVPSGGRTLRSGLVGTYYCGTNFEVPILTQVDAAPAFSWNTGSAWRGGPVDTFSVRWAGYLFVPKRGRYSFSLASDDGSRLFIDGVQILSNWKVNAEPARSPFMPFEEGYHQVTVEYFEDTYNASIALFWADSPDSAPSPIPTRQFYHDPAEFRTAAPARFPEAQGVLPAHANFVTAAAFSPDGKFVVTASEDRKAKAWSLSTHREAFTLSGHTQGILCVAFNPKAPIVATAGWDSRIRFWDAGNGQEIKSLEGHAGYVGSLAFSPDGRILASGSFDRTVKIWNVEDRSLLKSLEGHASSVEGLAFSPDGKLLASASLDHTVRIWEMPEGREARALEGHADSVQAVAFSPNGETLASCGWDGLIKLWDPKTGREKRCMAGHTSEVMSIAFSPDGKLLASGGNDSMVRLWDLTSGTELRVLPGHTGRVMGVSFAREGRLLVSASFDMTARLWDLKAW